MSRCPEGPINVFEYRILFGDTFAVREEHPGQQRYPFFLKGLRTGAIPFNRNARRLWTVDCIYRRRRDHNFLELRGEFR